MNCSATFDAAATNRSTYGFAEVPGGPFQFNTDHESGIYIESAQNAQVSDILIDRIIAVRSGSDVSMPQLLQGSVSQGCGTR
jgi:hypothetical protein